MTETQDNPRRRASDVREPNARQAQEDYSLERLHFAGEQELLETESRDELDD